MLYATLRDELETRLGHSCKVLVISTRKRERDGERSGSVGSIIDWILSLKTGMDEKDEHYLLAKNQLDSLTMVLRDNKRLSLYYILASITLRYEIDRQLSLLEAEEKNDQLKMRLAIGTDLLVQNTNMLC